MNFRGKAFPHPVLRPDTDDYQDSAFETIIEPTLSKGDDQSIDVELCFSLSSESLNSEITQNRASFALDVNCPDTLYRKVFHCKDSDTIKFKEKELYGRVSFTGMVICRKAIDSFSAYDLHPEFGSRLFSFRPGDILAFDQQVLAFVEFSSLSFESLIRAQSCHDIDPNSYKIEVEAELITILMGPTFYKVWNLLREENSKAPFLAMSVYKDCLLVALQYIVTSEDSGGYRWSKALIKKLDNYGIELPRDPEINDLNLLAQQLVAHLGIKKALNHGQ